MRQRRRTPTALPPVLTASRVAAGRREPSPHERGFPNADEPAVTIRTPMAQEPPAMGWECGAEHGAPGSNCVHCDTRLESGANVEDADGHGASPLTQIGFYDPGDARIGSAKSRVPPGRLESSGQRAPLRTRSPRGCDRQMGRFLFVKSSKSLVHECTGVRISKVSISAAAADYTPLEYRINNPLQQKMMGQSHVTHQNRKAETSDPDSTCPRPIGSG